jgi:hypothetical protein
MEAAAWPHAPPSMIGLTLGLLGSAWTESTRAPRSPSPSRHPIAGNTPGHPSANCFSRYTNSPCATGRSRNAVARTPVCASIGEHHLIFGQQLPCRVARLHSTDRNQRDPRQPSDIARIYPARRGNHPAATGHRRALRAPGPNPVSIENTDSVDLCRPEA